MSKSIPQIKLSILVFFLVTISGCGGGLPAGTSTIEATLKNTDLYEHDFNFSGDEEGASIEIMAEHFEICEIVRDSSTNWNVTLRYKPSLGFTGSDFVEVETCTGGTGTSCSTREIFQFNFMITN